MSLKTMPGFGKSGISRTYACRSMPVASGCAYSEVYELSSFEATMPMLPRPAPFADAAVLADYNARLAEESEGKALDRATLDAGVAAALADPNKGRYFVAEIGGT